MSINDKSNVKITKRIVELINQAINKSSNQVNQVNQGSDNVI